MGWWMGDFQNILLMCYWKYSAGRYNMVNFLMNIHTRKGEVWDVFFSDPTSDWYSARVPAMVYVISNCIGLRSKHTWLYNCNGFVICLIQ